jgi:AraC-like DNA-binding protein
MLNAMPALTSHKIYRDAHAPWWELRVSRNSNDCYRPHTHDEYSIGIVDAGWTVFQYPDGAACIGPGAVVLIAPNVVHSCNPRAMQRWNYRMLFVQAEWLHQAMGRHWGWPEPVRRLAFPAPFTTDAKVAVAVSRLCRPSASMTRQLAAGLPALLSGLAQPAAAHAGFSEAAELAPAEALLRANNGMNVRVNALAEACGMTPSRFIRLFRKHHGMTPGDYLLNRRINEARSLLGKGLPISEVAYAMGFADQAHLHRMFKARHAMTPGHYRDPVTSSMASPPEPA